MCGIISVSWSFDVISPRGNPYSCPLKYRIYNIKFKMIEDFHFARVKRLMDGILSDSSLFEIKLEMQLADKWFFI